jgi:nucleoside-diphosphate-sugar epimerase
MKIAVTGARGFVGRHLAIVLSDGKHHVVPLNRNDWDLTSGTSPASLLAGCDAVVHLAAQVHRRGRDDDPAFVRTMFDTNVRGTERLARAAVECNVGRFVFLSSAAVYGGGDTTRSVDELTPCHPDTSYGRSKLAAEEVLQAIATETGLAIVALRPPLVYGAGAPGNFHTLVRLASRGWPVPSGALRARRSLISITNLCDLIVGSLETASLPRGAYVAAEPARPIGDLYSGLCEAAGRRPRVVPFPRGGLRWALDALGRADVARAVLDDFVMDAGAARNELNWSPRDLFMEELDRAMAAEAAV